MEIATIILLVVLVLLVLILLLLVLFRKPKNQSNLNSNDPQLKQQITELEQRLFSNLTTLPTNLSAQNQADFKVFNERIQEIKTDLNAQLKNLHQISNNQRSLLEEKLAEINKLIASFNQTLTEQLGAINLGILKNLKEELEGVRKLTNQKLDEIKGTVDQKLEETITKKYKEAYQTIDEQLKNVILEVGKMKDVAHEVNDFKKILGNTKTRGNLGENLLEDILSNILPPSHYEVQFTIQNQDKVDFAIKLPGKHGDEKTYLPIDAKNPSGSFEKVIKASETGDKKALDAARDDYRKQITNDAKNISKKYLNPPLTTSFAIMYLPSEAMYAEAVALGLHETLQKEYMVTLSGPTTMAALLSSLLTGFKTLMVQKQSVELWKILVGVQKEFKEFEEVLDKVYRQMNTAINSISELKTTRTNKLGAQLKKIDNALPLDLKDSKND